jgi:type I restriction enzyme S subunit
MITKFQTYTKYKDSGVDWIKTIPVDWTHDKIVSLFNFPNDKVSDEDFEPLSVTYGGVKKQVEDAAKTDNGSNRKLLKIGDIAFNGRSDRRGACGISEYEGSISVVYHVLRKKSPNIHTRFYHHLFRSTLFSQEFYRWGRGIHDDMWTTRIMEMKRIQVLVPPIEIQKRIADYLDEKTNIIDELIAKKEKLIESQKDKINTFVLGNNINLNRGISFWNNIRPEWKLEKARWIFEETNIRNKPNEELLAVTQDRGVLPKQMCEEQFVSPTSYDALKLVEVNDFVISLRSFEGGVEFSNYRGLVSPAYTVIRLNKKYNNNYYQKYYKNLLKTPHFIILLNTIVMGIRDGKNINYSDFKELILPIPTEDSIKKMMKDFEKHEKLVFYFEKQKKLLEEFRSSLINYAVTGKIKI